MLSVLLRHDSTLFESGYLIEKRTKGSFFGLFFLFSLFLNFGGHVMKHVLKAVAVGIVGASFALNASAADVNLGYQTVLGPWKAQMKDIEKMDWAANRSIWFRSTPAPTLSPRLPQATWIFR